MEELCLALRNDLIKRLAEHPEPGRILDNAWYHIAIDRLDPEHRMFVGVYGDNDWLTSAGFAYQLGLDVLHGTHESCKEV